MTQLHYTSTDEPGYSRKKWGLGFTYQDTDGNTIKDTETREWIESIAIPPAWTEVWINPNRNGHILATGRDDDGRKQYKYHPLWQEKRIEKKFNRLQEFGACLPHIRQTTDAHLRQRKVSRERVLAAVVRLLERTLIRIGNDEYARNNDSYGLTTLTDDHADIDGNKVLFDFVGKSGKEHSILLKDARLARIVKRCQDVPGYRLFQYLDEDGQRQYVDSSDVNDYLREITGQSFTAKVFRTWGGSTLAVKYLCEQCADPDGKNVLPDCVNHVAGLLGNTVAVSRKYYIHPLIFESFKAGKLMQIYEEFQDDDPAEYDLVPEENTLVTLIAQSTSK